MYPKPNQVVLVPKPKESESYQTAIEWADDGLLTVGVAAKQKCLTCY